MRLVAWFVLLLAVPRVGGQTEEGAVPAARVPRIWESEPESAVVPPATLCLRVLERAGGDRLRVCVAVLDRFGATVQTITTRPKQGDEEVPPSVRLDPGSDYWLYIRHAREVRAVAYRAQAGPETLELIWDRLPAAPRVTPVVLEFAVADGLATAHIEPGAGNVQVWREGNDILCQRHVDGDSIPFVTFERDGFRSDYGIYGLWGEKNPMSAPAPLAGDPVRYPDRDAVMVLGGLLVEAGLGAEAAHKVLQERRDAWFGVGLRVFLVVDRGLAGAVLPHLPEVRGLPLLIWVDLESPVR
ncbi:MAG: hypothetical protein AB7O52_17165 [Planctomycetota bacterium]